ncbi:MAG: nitroreductase family deazaflavin-dependent oxidoreductase [Thermomicrobiales bacterium]
MSEPTFTRERPNRLRRWLLSAPTRLYRGWLGELFRRRHILKLTTTGWRSGLPRATLVSYLPLNGHYIVFSGWGTRGHWYRNLSADPRVTIQVGRRRLPATAHPVHDPVRRRELMLAMRDFSDHCGPPPALRPLLRRLYDYDASIQLAVDHAEELPVIELAPDDAATLRH